jgi:hypothetical protein
VIGFDENALPKRFTSALGFYEAIEALLSQLFLVGNLLLPP